MGRIIKQTAVDYLVKELSEILGAIKTEPMQDLLLVDAIKKAKEMHKEQILEAYLNGAPIGSETGARSEIYYNMKYVNDDNKK